MIGMRSIALCAVATLAAHARGQMITTPGITAAINLSWQEDPAFAHNDNGLLEPGEHALIRMSLSFTGQFSHADFSPPVGGFTGGTILGLGFALVDITGGPGDAGGLYNNGVTVPASNSVGPDANSGGTIGYGVRGGWRLGGDVANGVPAANGFQHIGPSQLPISPADANTTNPIANLDRLSWAPNSYALRDVIFSVHPSESAGNNFVALYLDLDGGTTGTAAYLPLSSVSFGQVQVMYSTPAPGVPAVVVAVGMLAGRRRRRGVQQAR